MGEAATQDFAPDPDEGPLFPEGSTGDESGTLEGAPEPTSGPDAAAEPEAGAEGQGAEPAAEEAPGADLAGKRVVLVGPGVEGPFQVLSRPPAHDGGALEPILFEGDDREARLDALDRIEPLAEKVKAEPGSVVLATVPAASWKPRPPAPRARKSDWTV